MHAQPFPKTFGSRGLGSLKLGSNQRRLDEFREDIRRQPDFGSTQISGDERRLAFQFDSMHVQPSRKDSVLVGLVD